MRRLSAVIGFALCCALMVRGQCQNYTITVLPGVSFPAQISWQLVNAANVVVASGGAPASQSVCLPGGCYTLRKFDSGNDGWSWGILWIKAQPTNTVVATGTLVNSGFASQPVILGTGCSGAPCTSYTLTVTPGTSPAQIGWNLVDGLQVVQSGGAPASVALCLHTGCYTMQLFDSFGDGWNGAMWTLTDGFGTPVQSGTLTNGSKGAAVLALGVPPGNCNSVAAQFAGDCSSALEVCADFTWLTYPSGAGAVNEAGWNTPSNPYLDYGDGLYSSWGTDNFGCFQDGEINTTWMFINIIGSGTLEFVFGAGGAQHGYYDWIMYPYGPNTCPGILATTLPPVRCNYNAAPWGGTGITSTVPIVPYPGYLNYEPPLAVLAGERYLIGFSNHSGITANVLLDFGGTAVLGGCHASLPVELLSFTAEPEGWTVHLRWITATEINSERFEVERSIDATNWMKIGELAAAGHSQQALHYELIDPGPAMGLNYYRLQAIDLDGSRKTSAVVPVRLGSDDVLVHSDPSNGTIQVAGTGQEVRVFDASGREVAFLAASGSTQQITLSTPGVYLVRVGIGAEAHHQRVLIH